MIQLSDDLPTVGSEARRSNLQNGAHRFGEYGRLNMPRLTRSLPKYRKKMVRGIAKAVVTLDGQDIYLGPHGTKASKHEYDRLIGEWLANGRCLPDHETPLLVSELIAQYWKFAKGYYRKNGKPTDELASIKVALRHTRKLYGDRSVADFGPLALEAIRDVMIARDMSLGRSGNHAHPAQTLTR